MLGRLDGTDSHCFPAACLHWGLIEGRGDDQVYLDPLSLVGGGPVRLLPLWREEPCHGASAGGARLDSAARAVWSRPLDWLALTQARGCACW